MSFQFKILILVCVLILGILVLRLCPKEQYYPIYTTKKYTDIDPYSRNYINDKMQINETKLWSKKTMNFDIQKENLLLLKNFFEKHSIKYILDCGTLLGAVRDKNFITGDTDADISVGDIYTVIDNIRELEDMGFLGWRVHHYFIGISLIRKGEYIDLYKSIPLCFEVIEYPFLGTTFSVPKYYEDWLTEIYIDWKTPKHGYKGVFNWENLMPKYITDHCYS